MITNIDQSNIHYMMHDTDQWFRASPRLSWTHLPCCAPGTPGTSSGERPGHRRKSLEPLSAKEKRGWSWKGRVNFKCYSYLNGAAVSSHKIESDNISKKYCDTFKSFSCLLKNKNLQQTQYICNDALNFKYSFAFNVFDNWWRKKVMESLFGLLFLLILNVRYLFVSLVRPPPCLGV